MDYSKLKTDILKQLLHNQSTAQISQRLGYSFDQCQRWLNNTKELKWDEFCQLCEVLNIHIATILKEVFMFMYEDEEESYLFAKHLRTYLKGESLSSLQNKLNVHPSTLKRFFSGEVYPSFEFMLQMMDLQKNLLSSFVNRVVGVNQLSSLMDEFKTEQTQIQIETFWPIASAIEGLLCLEEYKKLSNHDPLWFCDKLSIQLDDFEKVWTHLLENQLVVADKNKYKINYTTINTNAANTIQVCKMVDFWTERARLRFMGKDHKPVNKKGGPNAVAYRIVPMSHETSKKATEILISAFQEILALAEKSTGPYEDVRVFLLHHFSVEDLPLDLDLKTQIETQK